MAEEIKSYRDVLDIIFDRRNKKYGAYSLRRNANKYLGRALLFGLLLIIVAYAIPVIANRTMVEEEAPIVEVDVELAAPPDIDMNEPPPPPPPPPPTPPPPTRTTQKFVPPVIKKDEEVVEEPEKVIVPEDIKDDVGKEDKKGKDDAPPEIIDNPTDLEPVEEVKAAPVVKDDAILDFVEKSASFPGGEAEMMKYLQENIVYPPIARENNITGRVILQFVVEKNGSITNVKVLRKLGGGTDEEAVRVVKQMPKWIPANQNGNAVRQRYTLPVFFKLAG